MGLPEGTVTFLFTDIEGSTRLWEEQPEAMGIALARHDELLRSVLEQDAGELIKSTGDGLQAVFGSAPDAVLAALGAQRAMITEPWDARIGRLKIRIALHTGTAELREGDYYGSAMNRAARLLSAGHGEQIILSQTMQEVVRDDLPAGVNLVDLGEYRLKDLTRPERVYQLIAPDLPREFPALNSDSVQSSNLPRQATPFIGREQELQAIIELLGRDDVCLVSLTGPGGAGKTRLALQAAADLLEVGDNLFANGVFFVDLAPINDPALVADTMASALGIRAPGGQTLTEALKQHFSRRSMLLVVDNFEHVMDGSDLMAELLLAAPKLKLLVTTREALNLQEEWLYPLAGMPYPAPSQNGNALDYSAVQLFTERARRVRPDFALTDEQSGVVRICQLVEGLPLAIELAAVWTKTLSSETIADEIQNNIDFLATRLRNLPPRHRSMRAAFDYSWQQLSETERTVFKRLSVFKGGFGRPAAGEIAGASLFTLTELVDKSLLRWEPAAERESSQGRYQIHEILRQFAAEQLENSTSDVQQTQADHANYYIQFLYQRHQDISGGRQREAVLEIKEELDNVRIAWLWAVAHVDADALQKGSQSLGLYYQYLGGYLEGMALFSQATEVLQAQPQSEAIDLALLGTLMYQAWYHLRFGRQEGTEACMVESQAIYRRLNIPPLPGHVTDPNATLSFVALTRGDYATAAQYAEQVCQVAEAQQHPINRQFAYHLLSEANLGLGEYETAQKFAQQAYAQALMTGDRWFMAYILNNMGQITVALGDLPAARRYYEESYAIREEFDDPEGMAVALNHLGQIALRERAYEESQRLFQRSHDIYEEINDKGGLATACNGLANTAAGLDQYRSARQRFHYALQIAAEINFVPLILNVLAGTGRLWLQTGRVERGEELLLTVLNHPASEYETKEQAGQTIKQYRGDPLPDQLVLARQQEQPSDLDAIVEATLMELEGLDIQLAEEDGGCDEPD